VSPNHPVVLIVDDHQESLAMYAFGLAAMGFQPVTAENAEDAFARACQIHPDAIVADVSLPHDDAECDCFLLSELLRTTSSVRWPL
jgi:CheY-like chemotaxis protein